MSTAATGSIKPSATFGGKNMSHHRAPWPPVPTWMKRLAMTAFIVQ
jgi:hypothetical protein